MNLPIFYSLLLYYIDVTFDVNNYTRIHTGTKMNLGKGVAISISNKHKIDSKSSTESEMVGMDDYIIYFILSHYLMVS